MLEKIEEKINKEIEKLTTKEDLTKEELHFLIIERDRMLAKEDAKKRYEALMTNII